MAKKSDFVDLGEKLDKLLEFMKTDAQSQAADKQGAKEEKTAKEGERASKASTKKIQKLGKSIIPNTAALVGLTGSMFTLKGVLGDLKSMNSDVSKSLTQVNLSTQGSRKTMERFNESSTGAQQQIQAFATAVELGMNNFSDNSLKLSVQLKAQGVNNKAVMGLMRHNVQALGLSEQSQLELVDSLVSTAAANGDSIEGLISAVDSMKDAMVETTVALGPEAAANANKIAAMMSQSNTSLQGAAADFVKSFLAGSDGFDKAARMGVVFTGQETTEEMAAKFEQIISKLNDMTGGMKGAGAAKALDPLAEGFGLSMQDINLAQQLESVSWAQELIKGNTDQKQKDLSKASVDQAYQNATRGTQLEGLEVMEGVATGLLRVSNLMGQHTIAIIAGFFTVAGFLTSILMAMRAGRIASALTSGTRAAGKPGMLSKASSALGKQFSKLGKFAGKMKYAFGSFSKSLKGVFSGGGFSVLKKSGGILAKGLGKVLGPITAVVTGVAKGMETGNVWDGVKRGLVSAAIYGAGVVLAPATGGASLLVAAALDGMAGDAITKTTLGYSTDGKEEEKQTTKNLAKQTQVSMMELGVTSQAGFTDDQLERIAVNTEKSMALNDEIRNMTEEDLHMKRAQLQEQKATPMTQLSHYFAKSLLSLDTIAQANEVANEQRATQVDAANNNTGGATPFSVGGA